MPVTFAQARVTAAELLLADGWEWDNRRGEWQHPDGRRGVLVYTPDLTADRNGEVISKVEIRHPNTEDGRIPPFTFVARF